MKTIEQAAYDNCHNVENESNFIDGFMAGAAFAQRWIPVEEELPEIKRKSYQVLAKVKPTLMGKVLYCAVTVYFSSKKALEDKFKNYTHWRPIEIQ